MFDISNPSLRCQHSLDAPIPVSSATGGVLFDKNGANAVICGGALGSGEDNDKCFVLGEDLSRLFADLPMARYGVAGIVTNDSRTMWITGGSDGDKKRYVHKLENTDCSYTHKLVPF